MIYGSDVWDMSDADMRKKSWRDIFKDGVNFGLAVASTVQCTDAVISLDYLKNYTFFPLTQKVQHIDERQMVCKESTLRRLGH